MGKGSLAPATARTLAAGTFVPCVRVRLPAALEDELPAVLDGMPVLGCELIEGGPGEVEARVYLRVGEGRDAGAGPGAQSHEQARELADLLLGLGAVEVVLEQVEQADWLAAYREHVQPFPIGQRWWMDPHPDSPTPAPEGRTRLAIEPRMAFGTGSHESTRLVLLELEAMAPDLEGARVLDVGTGSGVLALAVESLGAAEVVGLDIDLAAMAVAHQIAGQQEWPAAPLYLAGPVAAIGRAAFDLVLCNMIPDHFDPLLADLARLLAPEGALVLSGILLTQQDAVEARLAEAGLVAAGTRPCGEWLAIRARHG
jgi:ribosomal protein L11 methyltransferase